MTFGGSRVTLELQAVTIAMQTHLPVVVQPTAAAQELEEEEDSGQWCGSTKKIYGRWILQPCLHVWNTWCHRPNAKTGVSQGQARKKA